MGATIVPMPTGNININKLIGTLVAQYVPEGGSADFTDIEIGRIRLVSKKLMALSSASNDLLRTNAWSADVIIRDSMLDVMRVAMDFNLLYGTGGEDAPLGIANTEGISTDTISSVPTRNELVKMVATLGKANINVNDGSIGWVFGWDSWQNLYDERDEGIGPINQSEMDRGTLLGRKFMISNQVRTDGGTTDLFLGKWADVLVGEEFDIEITVDQSASFTDVNGKLVNAFTSDFTLFRGIMKHDIKLSRGVSFVVNTFNVA
jgi:HK97 family phage major capsid protein